jgi:hypothetical protein
MTDSPAMGRTLRAATPQRLVGVVLVALLVLVAADFVVRERSDRLPAHRLWLGPEMPYKSGQIAALHDAGGAGLVFVGSSAMDAAAAPPVFTVPPGSRPTYNASTGAGTLQMIDIWSRDFALPQLHPDVVVLGLTARELNANNTKAPGLNHDFAEAPEVKHLTGTESVLDTAERHLENWSDLFKYRTTLRDPHYMEALLGLGNAPGPNGYSVQVAATGQYKGFLFQRYNFAPVVRDVYANSALANFSINDRVRATLSRLLGAIKATGARVVVVYMPASPDLITLFPHGRADFDAAGAALRQASNAVGATYIDSGVWPRRYFADPGHVNLRGSLRFSRYLNATLHRDGVLQ